MTKEVESASSSTYSALLAAAASLTVDGVYESIGINISNPTGKGELLEVSAETSEVSQIYRGPS